MKAFLLVFLLVSGLCFPIGTKAGSISATQSHKTLRSLAPYKLENLLKKSSKPLHIIKTFGTPYKKDKYELLYKHDGHFVRWSFNKDLTLKRCLVTRDTKAIDHEKKILNYIFQNNSRESFQRAIAQTRQGLLFYNATPGVDVRLAISKQGKVYIGAISYEVEKW